MWPSQAEKDAGPERLPRLQQAGGARVVGRALQDPARPRRGRDLERHERARGLQDRRRAPCPSTSCHDNEGQPTDHREIHNVYGLLMTRSTYEGLLRLRPDERPFVLTRATFAGGQRYSAIWPGDNVSDWSAMRDTIPMFANMGLSGFSFVGADIGGFADAPSPELFTRWLQMGVFYPFMRVHTTFGTPDQEPWS